MSTPLDSKKEALPPAGEVKQPHPHPHGAHPYPQQPPAQHPHYYPPPPHPNAHGGAPMPYDYAYSQAYYHPMHYQNMYGHHPHMPPHVYPGYSAPQQQASQTPATAPIGNLETPSKKAAPSSNPNSKKRPYRRTKRPKNYCDKSTITTTTDKVALNAYDAVLGESDDLLLAAKEAQRLGRVKIASAYLLLLHARLVGLGKRFDKARQAEQDAAKTGDDVTAQGDSPAATSASATETGEKTIEYPESPPSVKKQRILQTPPSVGTIPASTNSAVAKKFASMLPSNIEMDQAMMEHLAAAAVELHAARSGRKYPRDSQETAAEMGDFLAQTANEQNITNAVIASGSAVASSSVASSTMAWEPHEKRMLEEGIREKKSVADMAAKLGRSQQQVKAYVRNRSLLNTAKADIDMETPKKKGRGRKPTTTAMNTNPHASCDVRSLLKGNLLNSMIKESGTDDTAEHAEI